MSAHASSTLRRSPAENSSRVRPRTLLSCATGAPGTTAVTRSTSASRTSRVRSPVQVIDFVCARPSRAGERPRLRRPSITSGMPDKISLICACRRLCGSPCPSSWMVMRVPTSFVWCRELSSIIGVKPGDSDTGDRPSDPAELLSLALSRPHDALLAARSCWLVSPVPTTPRWLTMRSGSSCAIAETFQAAITELRKGVRLARASGRARARGRRAGDPRSGARLDWPQPARTGHAGPGARRPPAATWLGRCSCGAPGRCGIWGASTRHTRT